MLSVSKSRTSLRLLADGAIAVLLAPVCAGCGQPLEHPTRGAVCDACWAAIRPLHPRGRQSFPPFIDLAMSIGPYEGRLRDVIQSLKYGSRPTIAKGLAALMRETGADVLAGADALVSVPLHRSRQRVRGFNQARELARHLGVPVIDALARTRRTAVQADLPAARRHANVRGAFAVCRNVDGLVIVLIDDVCTTGATLNACAAELLDAGAADVRALVAATAMLKQP